MRSVGCKVCIADKCIGKAMHVRGAREERSVLGCCMGDMDELRAGLSTEAWYVRVSRNVAVWGSSHELGMSTRGAEVPGRAGVGTGTARRAYKPWEIGPGMVSS